MSRRVSGGWRCWGGGGVKTIIDRSFFDAVVRSCDADANLRSSRLYPGWIRVPTVSIRCSWYLQQRKIRCILTKKYVEISTQLLQHFHAMFSLFRPTSPLFGGLLWYSLPSCHLDVLTCQEIPLAHVPPAKSPTPRAAAPCRPCRGRGGSSAGKARLEVQGHGAMEDGNAHRGRDEAQGQIYHVWPLRKRLPKGNSQ